MRIKAGSRFSSVILALLLVMTPIACSSSNVAQSPAADNDDEDRPADRGRDRSPTEGGARRTPSPSPAKPPGERVEPSRQVPRPTGPIIEAARLQDARSDAQTQGEAPSFAEVVRASIKGHADEVLLSATFGAPLPERMPDRKTFLHIGFRLQAEDSDESIGLLADDRGWTANLNGRPEFPGRFAIRGATLFIAVSWEEIGGSDTFNWLVSTNWTRASESGTEYAFDSAPNEGPATYPER